MNQRSTLFDDGPPLRGEFVPNASLPPFQPASATSQAAAKRKAGSAESDRAKVLAFIRSRGEHGATRHEIALALNMPIQSVCGRVWELCGGNAKNPRPKLVRESGRTRATDTGSPSGVLVAIEEAA